MAMRSLIAGFGRHTSIVLAVTSLTLGAGIVPAQEHETSAKLV